MHSFEELEVWKSARDLRIAVSICLRNVSNEEKFRLKDQLLRSSRSVTANISEGFGRFHFLDNIRFCRMARGSLYETLDHIICAFDEGYIDEDKLNELRLKISECLKLLNGYIAYLKKAKAKEVKKY